MILAIACNEYVIVTITEKSLVLAATAKQQIIPITTLEFLHGAFAANQGIGATLIIEQGASIIAVEILEGTTGGVYVDAADQAIRARTAKKNLARPRAAQKDVVVFLAIKPLPRSGPANKAVVAEVTIKPLIRTTEGN